jgi:hypothetical protein
VSGIAGPIWLKLSRLGDAFSGYYSTNGSTWTQVGGTQTAVVGTAALAGLAVSSRSPSTVGTAGFTGVASAATAGVPSPWSDGDIGSPTTFDGKTRPITDLSMHGCHHLHRRMPLRFLT